MLNEIRRLAGLTELSERAQLKPGENLYTLDGKKGVWRTMGGARIFFPVDGSPAKSGRGKIKPSDVGVTGPTDVSRIVKGLKKAGNGGLAKKVSNASSGRSSIIDEPTVGPRRGKVLTQDPYKDGNGDGITDESRVGVGGSVVPPPPKRIPRLPNLTQDERDVEESFADAFESDPDALVADYLAKNSEGKLGEKPNVFSTDAAKKLSIGYNPQGVSEEKVLEHHSRYNTAVHQTANAIAKKAFLKYLDDTVSKLPEEKKMVLITSGGVAAGKGYAIGKVDQVAETAGKAAAVWDAAGEQNGTENPWVLDELEKRGIRAFFVYVHADPATTWENPGRGVIDRAKEKGRMVDARVYADSYALGGKNFKKFRDQNRGRADFAIVDNSGGEIKELDDMPEAALNVDAEAVYSRASEVISTREGVSPHILRGGTIGQRIWGPPKPSKKSAKESVSSIVRGLRQMLDESKRKKSKRKKSNKRSKEADDMTKALIRNLKVNNANPKAYEKAKFNQGKKASPYKKAKKPGPMPDLNDDGSLAE